MTHGMLHMNYSVNSELLHEGMIILKCLKGVETYVVKSLKWYTLSHISIFLVYFLFGLLYFILYFMLKKYRIKKAFNHFRCIDVY